MECGEASALNIFNYAGLDVQKDGNHAFPYRIKSLVLPGNSNNQFLCADCANKRTVECSFHRKISYSDFEMGNIPTCAQCEKQLKAILDKKLPPGFKSLMFPVKIYRKGQESILDGIAAISNDGYVHIIDGKVRSSISEKDISGSITNVNSGGTLQISVTHNTITTCEINLNDKELFHQSSGPWIDVWKKDINSKLELPDGDVKGYCSILEIESKSISTKKKGFLKKESGKYAFSFRENQLRIFPEINFQSIDNLTAWHTESFYPDKSIELKFEENTAVQVLKLNQKRLFYGLDRIEDLKKSLPPEKINDNPGIYDLTLIEFADANIYPGLQKVTCKMEARDTGLVITQLNNRNEFRSTTGYCYKKHWLINTSNKDSFTVQLSQISQIAQNYIRPPKELIEIGSNQYFSTFLDKKDLSRIRTIYLDKDKIVIDESDSVPYSDIKAINVIKLEGDIAQLTIKYSAGKENIVLKVVSTNTLCFNIWEMLETYKTNSETALMPINQLYEHYNKTKKKSLLTNLFRDILVLNSNINKDMGANDLSDKLSSISDDAFFKNKKLREITTQKMLLLSLFIPKIKQNFSLLDSYFPYYRIDSEISFLNEVFGENVAKNMLNSERKRIRKLTRNNIRMISANVLGKLNQIQHELQPLEQKFVKEKIQSAFSSKAAKNIPLVGQIILVGGMLVSGVGVGAVGYLGGILGIKL